MNVDLLGQGLWTLPRGGGNSISDVPGVLVGHVTLSSGAVQTGVTALVPGDDLFCRKMVAGCWVANGYGKTAGLVQIAELGTLETPILLTNTLSVGAVWDGLVGWLMEHEPSIGREAGTVNPVVAECNDGFLNDLRLRSVTPEMARQALDAASVNFSLGSVGAGRGMSCYELKGGIGTASRRVGCYTVGVLVLTNFGSLSDLTLRGQPTGRFIGQKLSGGREAGPDGSVIAVIATDAPLSSRQLTRLARRATVGVTRRGAFVSHGSGEISVAFSTASRIPSGRGPFNLPVMGPEAANDFFRAVVEGTDEAVLRSMLEAQPVVGRDGHKRPSLRDFPDAPGLEGVLEPGNFTGCSCR